MRKKLTALITLFILMNIIPLKIGAAQNNNAVKISIPTIAEEYVYNGNEQEIIKKEKGYIVQGNKGKNVGEYKLTLSLEEGYVWSDNTSEAKEFNWKIVPAQLRIGKITIKEKIYDGNTKAEIGEITVTDQKGNIYQGVLNITAEFEDAEVGNQKKVVVKILVPDNDAAQVSVNKSTVNTKGNIIRKTPNIPQKTKPSGQPGYTPITEAGKTLADANINNGTIAVEGKLSWVFPLSTIVEANKDYSWTFVPSDLNKYEIISGRILLYEVKEPEEKPDSDNNSGTNPPGNDNTGNNNTNNNTNNNNTNNNNNTGNNNNTTNKPQQGNTSTGGTTNKPNTGNTSSGGSTTVKPGNTNNSTNNTTNGNNVSGNTTTKPDKDKKPATETDKRTEQQKLKDSLTDKTKATFTNNVTKKKEDIRLEIRVSYPDNKITEGMKKEGIDSSERISEKLKQAIKENTVLSGENNTLYDVSLIYTEDHGKTWKAGGKNKFPKDGYLKVSIPIPGQLDPNYYDFAVAHMFTNGDFGKIPGEIEVPAVKERTDSYGIHYLDFYVTGLSPIMISWEESATISENNTSVISDENAEADIQSNEEATTEEVKEELTKEAKIKLAIFAAGSLAFLILTIWVAKKIAWG